MAIHIRRREFLSLLGGAAAAWPLAARGQPSERVRRVGVLTHFAADDPEGQHRLTAFEQGMRKLGWAVGRNLQFAALHMEVLMFGLRMLVVVALAVTTSLAPAAAQVPVASTPETKQGEDAAKKSAQDASKKDAEEAANAPHLTLGQFESGVLAGGGNAINVLKLPFAETMLPVLPDGQMARIKWNAPSQWWARSCDKEQPPEQEVKAISKKAGTESSQTLVGFLLPAPRCWLPLSQRATLTIVGNIVETNQALSGKRPLFEGEVYVTVFWLPLLITLLVIGIIYAGCAAIYCSTRRRNYLLVKAPLSETEASELEHPPSFPESLDPVQITTNAWGHASLGKLQLFLFSLIIFGFLLFNVLRRDVLAAISTEILWLLGITVVGAAGGKIAYARNRRLSFVNYAWLIRHRWLPKADIAPRTKWSELFFDGNTNEFDPYGFQMAIFSVVVGVALARTSFAGLGTFQIPNELLALLGISHVAFVGGKALDETGYPELDGKLNEVRKHEQKIAALKKTTDAKPEGLPKEQGELIECTAAAAQMFAELFRTELKVIPPEVEEAANRMATVYEHMTEQADAPPSKPVEEAKPVSAKTQQADAASSKPVEEAKPASPRSWRQQSHWRRHRTWRRDRFRPAPRARVQPDPAAPFSRPT
jgi:hypothetical protein